MPVKGSVAEACKFASNAVSCIHTHTVPSVNFSSRALPFHIGEGQVRAGVMIQFDMFDKLRLVEDSVQNVFVCFP